MAVHFPNKFHTIADIVGAIAVTETASFQTIGGHDCTISCVSGNLYINTLGTAVADATSYKITAGTSINLWVFGAVSMVSDGSGAVAQVLIYT